MITFKKLMGLMGLIAGTVALFGNEPQIRSGSFDSGGGRSEGASTAIHGVIGAPIAGFSGGGNVSLTSGFPTTLEVVLPKPDESFFNWIESLPAPHQPPVGQRGVGDQPAGDGMSNLLKYFLGLMPMTPSAESAPRIVLLPFTDPITGTAWHWMGLEFRSAPAAAVDFVVEHGGNLTDWQPVPFSMETLGQPDQEGRQQVRITTTVIADNYDTHFLRLTLVAK